MKIEDFIPKSDVSDLGKMGIWQYMYRYDKGQIMMAVAQTFPCQVPSKIMYFLIFIYFFIKEFNVALKCWWMLPCPCTNYLF